MPAVQTSGATNAATYVMGSVYYGAQLSPTADLQVNTPGGAGNIGPQAGGFGSVGVNTSPYGNLPIMPNCLTPSINVYYA